MNIKHKVFVINLEDYKERFDFVNGLLANYGIVSERVDGVYVDSLPKECIRSVYSPSINRKSYVRKLHKGQIGCYLAHMNAWRRIVEEDLDYAVVLEDDVKILEDFPAALKFLDENFGSWDFVRIAENSKMKKIFAEKKYEYFSFVQYINLPGGATGYAISKASAKKLLDNLIPFGMPVDVNIQYYYKYGVRVDSLRPPIISNCEFGENSVLRLFDSGEKENAPFIRQRLSIKFYFGRMKRLIKEYGFFYCLLRLLKMPFQKKII